MLPPVLRYIGDAQSDRFGGRPRLNCPATQANRPTIGGHKTEQDLCEFSTSRSNEAGNAKDLASAHGEIDIVDCREGGETATHAATFNRVADPARWRRLDRDSAASLGTPE